MADYQDYNKTACFYDETRSATGCGIWFGELLSHFESLERLKVLDAGCGTGNYALALAKHVEHVSAIDVNGAMLAMASEKIGDNPLASKIDFDCANLTQLPFEDCSFDAVMFNQVLHHLDPKGEDKFKQLRLVLNEAARVLRPDGLVLINTSSRLQMRHSFWYLELVPEARQQGVDHMAGTDDLKELLHAADFELVSRTIPLDSVLQGPAFFNHLGPYESSWRAGDSIWSLADDIELSTALTKIAEMDAAGTLREFMEQQDQGRQNYGQITFWVAKKCT